MAIAARRARSLTTSGALAAAAIGSLAVAAGWAWGALLIAYFATSTLLSRLGGERKARRTASVVEKGGARDATQVLVNGGMFAVAAAGYLLTMHPVWRAVGAGALAAAAADTWATEVGTWLGGTPRSAWNWRRVPPGTSGGMTTAGTIAMVAGAAAIALLVHLLQWGRALSWGAAAGGLAGAVADTVLGATLQERRRCLGCGDYTERLVHSCGSRSRHARGIPGFNNDLVNLAASLIGSGVAYKVAELIGL
ncbi:MAG: DUF92 domain-containing protein [Gemmatimonadaceae bacterium]|nr:DUF92 domain-containing protein [Gemmatimonadaceae bacterium]NUQ91535.1 DUF92 domain-containing protein [Gemmatimonadaceae bacterium]NUS97845.1 DUF92 domain-containing protein [Gemmatimonadaceae bacterium]